MEYKSEAKYLRISPRKLRRVVDAVKKQELNKILASLGFMNERGASFLLKALNSAIKNVEERKTAGKNKITLKTIEVNEGPRFKRWRPASRGRAHPYNKTTSHIRIVLKEEAEKNGKKD